MKSNNVNYYHVLDISPSADEKEIKQTYLKLARKYHPDKNKGNKLAEEKFKRINEAYQALKDPKIRRALSAKLKRKKVRPIKRPAPVSPDSFSGSRSLKPTPFNPGQTKEQPLDLETALTVSLEAVCQNRPCVVNYLQPENGKRKKASFFIQIPGGVRSGDCLLFENRGGAVGKKMFGDLYVEVRFKPHNLFKAKGWDVYFDFPVPFPDVFLGKTAVIPTLLKEDVQLKIPAGTSHGTQLKLKNFGLPKKAKKERGDMFVRILIDYPPDCKKRIHKEMSALKGKGLQRYLKKQEDLPLHYPKVEEYRKLLQKRAAGET